MYTVKVREEDVNYDLLSITVFSPFLLPGKLIEKFTSESKVANDFLEQLKARKMKISRVDPIDAHILPLYAKTYKNMRPTSSIRIENVTHRQFKGRIGYNNTDHMSVIVEITIELLGNWGAFQFEIKAQPNHQFDIRQIEQDLWELTNLQTGKTILTLEEDIRVGDESIDAKQPISLRKILDLLQHQLGVNELTTVVKGKDENDETQSEPHHAILTHFHFNYDHVYRQRLEPQIYASFLYRDTRGRELDVPYLGNIKSTDKIITSKKNHFQFLSGYSKKLLITWTQRTRNGHKETPLAAMRVTKQHHWENLIIRTLSEICAPRGELRSYFSEQIETLKDETNPEMLEKIGDKLLHEAQKLLDELTSIKIIIINPDEIVDEVFDDDSFITCIEAAIHNVKTERALSAAQESVNDLVNYIRYEVGRIQK